MWKWELGSSPRFCLRFVALGRLGRWDRWGWGPGFVGWGGFPRLDFELVRFFGKSNLL
jgi:hypothetical protein